MSTESQEPRPSAIDDMLADLGFDHPDDDQLRTALTDVRAQATEVPVASPEVVALLQGATPLRRLNHRRVVAVAAAGALAFGGASAAAATNNLPDPIQAVVAKVTGAPHPHAKPVKPTDAPDDAPGQLRDKNKDKSKDKPAKADGDNSDAPGQIQKATKPDTAADGPAKPADPGSHGRARADEVQASHTKGDNKKDRGDKPAKHKAKKPKASDHPNQSNRRYDRGRDNDSQGRANDNHGGNRH